MAFSTGNYRKATGNSQDPKGGRSGKKYQPGIDEPGRQETQKQLTPEQAWEKIKPFCSYQERCHKEVKDKLYSYGLHRDNVEQLLSRLIEENYLNEERFAVAFAGGHFRMKHWGKIKITHALKQKGVSAYCLKQALQAIDPDEYEARLQKLAAQKWVLLQQEKPLARHFKCRQFLTQKGYESNLITAAIRASENGNGEGD